jgi:hypothetical protein
MRDKVTTAVAVFVLNRDGGCVAPRLGGSFMDCSGRNRLEHVQDGGGRMGRRAKSDPAHLVTLCSGHTEEGMRGGYVWATHKTNRQAMRDYLREVNDADRRLPASS